MKRLGKNKVKSNFFLVHVYSNVLYQRLQIKRGYMIIRALELCKPPESDSNLQDDDCTYVPDTDLQENHEITPPSKHPKLLAIKGSFINRRKEKQSNNSTSLSSEEKEVDRYSKNSFNLELELKMTPLTFGIPLKIIQSLHLLPVTFYVYHLQQPQLKGCFQQVGNQHLENTTD